MEGSSFLDLLMAQQEEVSGGEEVAGGGGIWVVADVADGAVVPVTLEALGAARTLADSLGAYVYAVLLGDGVRDMAQVLYQVGADSVRVAEDAGLADFALEPYLRVLSDLFKTESPEVVLCGDTPQGRELAPRLAQELGGGLIEGVVALSLDEATRTVRGTVPIYGGMYFEVVACPEARPQFLTLQPGAFPSPFLDTYRTGEPKPITVEPTSPAVRVIGKAEDFEPPELPLAQAPLIVAVGRQVGDLDAARQLAQALGARLAGDRGARDAGWIATSQVVDVRGVVVAPEVYVAIGVRGDTFHNAAIEEADFIVAIHPDADAAIFEVADLCVTARPEEVLPPLLEALAA